jgi:hypothetical protein
MAHGLFVPLDGAALRLLGAPAQSMQEPTDMIRVIANAEAPADPLRHTRTGPQVGGKPSRLRPAQQVALQATEIARLQALRTARDRAGGQGAGSLAAHRRLPAPHAAPVDADTAGHLDRGASLFEQRPGAKPAAFEFLRTPVGSHLRPRGKHFSTLVLHVQITTRRYV